MCGRFVRFSSWADLRSKLTFSTVTDLLPSYNVAPTQKVLVAREHDGNLEGVTVRWGLMPSWAKDKKAPQINARAETVAEKPMFRSAFKKRRCLILADGYYEWKKLDAKTKQPYLLKLRGGEPFVFAGLWEIWKDEGTPLETCTIITTEANDLSRVIHDRMPVILQGPDVEAWIDRGIADAGALKSLLRPFATDEMAAFPVSARVGKVSENEMIVAEAGALP